MNEIEKAISQLEDLKIDRKDFSDGVDDEVFKNYIEAIDYAIQALGKQTPKKPNIKVIKRCASEVTALVCCPSCGRYLINYWNQEINPPHCMMCGQALDWSEFE